MTFATESQPGHRAVHGFHELMRDRVQRILLVTSLYDSFILSEEGHLQETLLTQFIEHNVSSFPTLVQVSTGEEALALFDEDAAFDLVIATVREGEMDPGAFAAALHAAGHGVPVLALAYTGRELYRFLHRADTRHIERTFLYQGDLRLLLAMILYREDRRNAAHDVGVRGVPAIILVEDSIRFYSSFLPTIYGELFRHTHDLLSEDLNLSQRVLRMRARPKVLLSDSYEGAWDDFERYEDNVLGIISDFNFPREGQPDPRAGLELCARARKERPDLRLVMQSSVPENRVLAEELGASFLTKGSPMLLHQLQDVLTERFGFGAFIFRLPDGSEVDRAKDLKSLAEKIRTVPAESIAYHGERNHFSNWVKARTELSLADRLQPRDAADFESPEHFRGHLLEKIEEYRLERLRSVTAEFQREKFDARVTITRIGSSSLGGKARGVAFANRILRDLESEGAFPGVDLYVPPAVVLATDVFDEFLKFERIHGFALGVHPDEEVEAHFLRAPFPRRASHALRAMLQRVNYPLAVRSSSLLEDSISQPFAGVYQTLMVPNNAHELSARLYQLEQAVQRVYASAFTSRAKAYLAMTSYRHEEEKMGVMVQQLVGRTRGDCFYPDFAGVARSYNFYPEPGHEAEDGVAAVALGLGKQVVSGGSALRFNPRHPTQLVTFSSVPDALENSQRELWALDLSRRGHGEELVGIRPYPLELAEEHGPLAWLGSTYLPDDNRIVDGISRPGIRLVSFAQVLKHDAFPLAGILSELLDRCSQGTGGPVEIEFAGMLAQGDAKARFAFLQLRPLALSKETERVTIGDVATSSLVCRSQQVLGNGVDELHDVVVVDLATFDRMRTPEVAQQVAHFDALLRKDDLPYVLIGVGRWGSADPSLGIPVGWNQISGARVIVESGFQDLRVAPSQGTHFFQNLTSSNVGYMTVNPDHGEGHLDWEWLAEQPEQSRMEFVRHLRTRAPIVVKLSGRTHEGVIQKPKG